MAFSKICFHIIDFTFGRVISSVTGHVPLTLPIRSMQFIPLLTINFSLGKELSFACCVACVLILVHILYSGVARTIKVGGGGINEIFWSHPLIIFG